MNVQVFDFPSRFSLLLSDICTMAVDKFAYMCMIMFSVTHFHQIKGHVSHEQFLTAFLKCFNTGSPVFISSDKSNENYDYDIIKARGLISYTINEEEEDLAQHLEELYFSGDLTMVLFLDAGHQKLLNILMNDLQLFKKGLAALLSESDVNTGLDLALRFDSKVYFYSKNGKTFDIKEAYAINKNTIVREIGAFDEDNGLSVPTTSIWERRANMEGMTIRVATVSYPLFHELHYDTAGASIIGGSGVLLQPLNILANKLNFTLKLMPSNDGQFGGKNDNGTWNGMIKMLLEGQADIAVALGQTEDRAVVTTFSTPLAEEKSTLMSLRTRAAEVDPWIYLDIFPHSAWYLSGATVVSIAVCFVIMNCSGINYMHDTLDSEEFTLLNGLGLSLTFFRQIYYEVRVRCISTRILFVLSSLSTYLLYVHYTAYLTAVSTSVQETSIKSFEDVLKGGYTVIVWENTLYQDTLKFAESGTPMHEVYYKKMIDNPSAFAQSNEEAMKAMHSQKKALFYGSEWTTILYDDLTLLDIQGFIDVNF